MKISTHKKALGFLYITAGIFGILTDLAGLAVCAYAGIELYWPDRLFDLTLLMRTSGVWILILAGTFVWHVAIIWFGILMVKQSPKPIQIAGWIISILGAILMYPFMLPLSLYAMYVLSKRNNIENQHHTEPTDAAAASHGP